MAKIVSSAEAANLIKDGQSIAVGGFVGFATAEEVLGALEKRFLTTGSPKNLFVMNCAGVGDKKDRGMNHFGHEGFVRKVYCGHIGLAPKLANLVSENKVECYIVPQGVTTHILRAIAGKKPGVITHVGLKTYADPRVEGCRANDISKEEVVELIKIDNKEYLRYKPFPVNVAIIRGTTADENGNITVEKEALFSEQIQMAQAAKNSGGIVIAQVERIARKGSLNPQYVKIPGICVDFLVVAKPENHCQSFVDSSFNPSWSGQIKVPVDRLEKMKLNQRKVCARRAAMELRRGAVVNLGIGVPDGVANVAAEEGLSDQLVLTIESGAIGGIPAGGLGIGASLNPEAIIDQDYNFDFYDGGGLDICYLGLAEADEDGNLNVSKFSGRVVGPGGFINISQNSKKLVFCGTFTASGLKTEISDGRLKIIQEGRNKKFKKHVEQITFSGEYAAEAGQKVFYITERAVFELRKEGMVLIEIAPGVDLEKDVISQMEFRPIIAENLKIMDERIFKDEPMNLKLV
ncbi:acyl CoA:acetate/3-ketoacid CoA transferase [Sporolactobacillus sp. CQH2019]|uniref:acyl CoA:acetate/3-ketoacid CoA transferase n=1 Tax=Sporolactobacillus sp. CQH2019 TaxID=3023512 RepID=UPI00236855B2|nr:CoA-transferase [Sporolactobacillus sp. CQH2019]MDD9148182.1 acyl CoA:acetate/3-ketoacid CoA transferase [Sporolactobacillus sp. CQH2019]